MPESDTARWFVLWRLRQAVGARELVGMPAETINEFLRSLPPEHRATLLLDLVPTWAELGATEVLLETLREVTGP